jgi:hypothetical protein
MARNGPKNSGSKCGPRRKKQRGIMCEEPRLKNASCRLLALVHRDADNVAATMLSHLKGKVSVPIDIWREYRI